MPGPSNPYLRYSGLALQLLLTIGFGVWLGMWLDRKMGNRTPWFTIGCSLLFLGGALYSFIRSLPKT